MQSNLQLIQQHFASKNRLARSCNSLLDILMPIYCLCCDLKSDTNIPVCSLCYPTLPWQNNVCRLCANILPKSCVDICGRCIIKAPPWQECISLWQHCLPISNWINQLKHHSRLELARMFGLLLGTELKLRQIEFDAILPIPLHKTRLKQRGFNQAIEIARHLKAIKPAPILLWNIQREFATKPQQGLSHKLREQNLKNAFKLKKDIRAKTILIIDDVLTTGATCREVCKHIPKQHTIIFACISRTQK